MVVNTLVSLNRGFAPSPSAPEHRLEHAHRPAGADHHDVAEPAVTQDRLRADLDYEVNLKNEVLLTEIRNRLYEDQRTARATPRDPR